MSQNNFGFEPNRTNVERRYKLTETKYVADEGWKRKVDNSRNKKAIDRAKALFTYEKNGIDTFDVVKQDRNLRNMKHLINRIDSLLTFSMEVQS